jgi:hypothetical protein
VIFTIASRGAPVGQCTSGTKPCVTCWPNTPLVVSESVIHVGLSQARVHDCWLPVRNIDW